MTPQPKTEGEKWRDKREAELIKTTESWTREDLILAILDAEEEQKHLLMRLAQAEKERREAFRTLEARQQSLVGQLRSTYDEDDKQELRLRIRELDFVLAALTQKEKT